MLILLQRLTKKFYSHIRARARAPKRHKDGNEVLLVDICITCEPAVQHWQRLNASWYHGRVT